MILGGFGKVLPEEPTMATPQGVGIDKEEFDPTFVAICGQSAEPDRAARRLDDPDTIGLYVTWRYGQLVSTGF
jgi:hypothetical protein